MPWFDFFWTDENEQHVAEHDLSVKLVEFVVKHPEIEIESDSSGRPACKGHTRDGRYIFVAYEFIDDITVYVVTAFEIES